MSDCWFNCNFYEIGSNDNPICRYDGHFIKENSSCPKEVAPELLQKLKPCPFCGNKFPRIEKHNGVGSVSILCTCGLIYQTKDSTINQALLKGIEKWNHRIN